MNCSWDNDDFVSTWVTSAAHGECRRMACHKDLFLHRLSSTCTSMICQQQRAGNSFMPTTFALPTRHASLKISTPPSTLTLLSLPHTRALGCASGRLRQTAHVRSAREPRVRINCTLIWPRAAVRQISVVFDIFRLVHPWVHLGFVVCDGRQVCSEKSATMANEKA